MRHSMRGSFGKVLEVIGFEESQQVGKHQQHIHQGISTQDHHHSRFLYHGIYQH